MSSLLPPNSSALERAIAEAGIAAADLPVAIRALWDAETCPAALLPWLAWAWSADDWDDAWSERQKRETVKSALAVQRIKGTVGAVRNAIGALGFPVRVQEWFAQTPAGDPYTFRLLLDVDQEALSQASLRKILEVVESTKSLRSHLETALLSVVSRSTLTVAAVTGTGVELGVSFSSPSYADGTPALDLLTDAATHGEASTAAAIDSLHTLLHGKMTPTYW